MSKPIKPPIKPKNVNFSRALFTYSAKETDELSFSEGDLLYILDNTSDPDWWRARCQGKEGLVPSNFLTRGGNLGGSKSNEPALYPMHDACRRGNMELLEECLLNRVPVNAVDSAGNAPIHCAAHAGQVECLRRLLFVPQVNLKLANRLGDTPLHQAAWKGHVEVVQVLRSWGESGIDPNVKNLDGKTPLELAQDPDTKSELIKWIRETQITENKKHQSVGDYNAEDYDVSDKEEN